MRYTVMPAYHISLANQTAKCYHLGHPNSPPAMRTLYYLLASIFLIILILNALRRW